MYYSLMFKHAVEPLHVRRCGPVLPFFLKKINNLPQGSFCVSVSWIQINYLAIINNPRYGMLAFSLMMEWKVCYLLLDLHCFFFFFCFWLQIELYTYTRSLNLYNNNDNDASSCISPSSLAKSPCMMPYVFLYIPGVQCASTSRSWGWGSPKAHA